MRYSIIFVIALFVFAGLQGQAQDTGQEPEDDNVSNWTQPPTEADLENEARDYVPANVKPIVTHNITGYVRAYCTMEWSGSGEPTPPIPLIGPPSEQIDCSTETMVCQLPDSDGMFEADGFGNSFESGSHKLKQSYDVRICLSDDTTSSGIQYGVMQLTHDVSAVDDKCNNGYCRPTWSWQPWGASGAGEDASKMSLIPSDPSGNPDDNQLQKTGLFEFEPHAAETEVGESTCVDYQFGVNDGIVATAAWTECYTLTDYVLKRKSFGSNTHADFALEQTTHRDWLTASYGVSFRFHQATGMDFVLDATASFVHVSNYWKSHEHIYCMGSQFHVPHDGNTTGQNFNQC